MSMISLLRGNVWRIVVAFLVGFIFVGGAYITIRLRTLYNIQTEIAHLKAEHRHVKQELETQLNGNGIRIDQLERILFGDVIAQLEKKVQADAAKQKPPPPTWVELWQKNRDKELRDRIVELERRVYRLER